MDTDADHHAARKIITPLRVDCFHFRGDIPCDPHKRSGLSCTFHEFADVKRRGVIFKLGAAGDVLRTTPLLRALDPVATGTKILWVTHHPELLPPEVCQPVKPDASTFARLTATEWDFCWNLDKDVDACALAFHVRCKERAGYSISGDLPRPVDERAWHKFATGIDNLYSKSNPMSYIREIFDIVGIPYRGEEYWLREPGAKSRNAAEHLLPGRGWIGLNTGAGGRWPTRIWSEAHWLRLIRLIQERGLRPVIFGGPEEEDLNNRLTAASGALWAGVQSLEVFYAMLHRCNCLVTSVTQAMHLAIAAKTPLVLFNNIFNPNEFELYGRGEIVGPPVLCDCYYDAVCRSGRNCIDEITPEKTMTMILKTLNQCGNSDLIPK